jgi:dTDP-4-amino-4,6-dideoxygalactose transaminase
VRTTVPFLDLGGMTAEIRFELDRAWADALETSHFIGGAVVEAFEQAWAGYCGTSGAVGMANGTDALVLALRALGVGPGDEVVVPANTFVATAEAVVAVGATPRFADVDPDTLLLTAETMTEQVTTRTRAVIPVHLYGQMVDMVAVMQAAERADLLVVEDAAQAHGATWDGRPAGSFGHVGCFSFYPGKNLGAFGDGGAAVTSDPALDRSMRILRDHGRTPGSHYVHEAVGVNSRLDALQAAVLTVKLGRLDAWNAARRAIMAQYVEALEGSTVRPVVVHPRAASVHHLAVVRVGDRDRFRGALADAGVATGVHYPLPCHQQVAYQQYARGPLPCVEEAGPQVVSLPMFPTMSAEQVERVCEAVQQVRLTEEVGPLVR